MQCRNCLLRILSFDMAIIKMISKPPKTKANLNKLINYITKPLKTRPDLVGGHNCDPNCAYDDFLNVKAEFDKEDGIQAKHFVMSFGIDDDVSLEMAKEIADEMIKHKLFKDFQAVYAVHKDKEHIHIHFCVNSVNMGNGKRFHQTATDLSLLKNKANAVCRKYGLSEMDFNKNKGRLTSAEINNRFSS